MDSRLAASLAGAVATVPMTAVMTGFESSRLLPPRVITENALGKNALHLSETEREGVTMAAHLGFGATAGAGYAAFAGQSGLPPVVEGALYGVAIWGGNYLGLMPATGLYRPATEDKVSRNALMIGAHVVWGAALGLIWHRLAGRDRR